MRVRIRYNGTIVFVLLWMMLLASIACAEGTWRLDGDGKGGMPRDFRMASDDWHRPLGQAEAPPRRGLDALHASASAQPSLKSLSALYKKLVSVAPNPKQIYMVDLRQESHGFANGVPVSWYEEKNRANFGKDAKAVELDEAERLNSLRKQKTTFVPLGKSDTERLKPMTFAPKKVLTEREAAQQAGFRYVRFAAADMVWPDAKTVEDFLAFVAALPEDAWLHFHCHAGHGRTTTFLVMYDLLRNPDVSLEDVARRQYLLGGTDLLSKSSGEDWYAQAHNERAEMLRLFYRYASELRTKDTSLSWSAWLERERKPKGPEKAFPPKPTGRLDSGAMDRTEWVLPPSYSSPLMETGAKAGEVTILGPAEVSQRQMVRFLEQRNPKTKLNCTPTELVSYYYEEAGREGIRPDVALCQAFKETGFFNYGGDVLPEQNNFCGLGATGNRVKGARFASPRLGARAHIQHLLAYASTNPPSVEIVDPRYDHIVNNRQDIHGQIHTWTGLNGVWAVPGTHYGQDILNLWGQAKAPDGSPESLQQAEMNVRKKPKDAGAYLERGIAYANAGKPEEALRDYGESLRLRPSAEAYYDRALVHETLGEFDAALADYSDAVRLEVDFPQGWYNRGNLCLRLGMDDRAIADFQQSLRLIPQLANAYVGMGIADVHQKKYDAAWQEFYAAGTTNSANQVVKANQKLIMDCLAGKR